MSAPDLQRAAAFLDLKKADDHAGFAIALRKQIIDTNGLFLLPASDHSGGWASAMVEINLFGIAAFGSTEEQAIRNWKLVATRLIDPSPNLTHMQATLLAWSLEALSDPNMLRNDNICRRACQVILNHATDPTDRARALAVMETLPVDVADAA
ncbi:MAG: hypothetical protein ABJL67_13175 [Sulfitobacter sp.]